MSNEHTNSNARDAALGSLPPELREALLRKASDLGVHRADDVVWAMVASVLDATLAAQVAGQHVKTLALETQKVPNLIYQGTMKAGADLSAAVAQGIENKTAEAGAAVVQAIGVAASRGAQELQRTAAGLDKLGQEKGAAFVEQWKTDLARAVAAQAKSSLAWRLGKGYGIVAGALLIMMLLGAAIAVGAGVFAHKIIDSPHAQWRGHEIVFTSPHVYHVQCQWGVCFSSRPASQGG
ncbi:hypothetical protein C4901_07340 [Acidiferrobacter sp. SPIII_3]|uniref:hypothetical protein n=1 Tax=Acidiferrobacter sp. SPIII_3 TaxID=1281578 RepID=UPI000D72BF18|nr:hypothetical protein [Acidiferrobacter sp. SPIII_3]AWP23164.1 hypothetical protein C4901_07340 [Acidiferrobacter sp. SPIII_3]